MPTRFLAAFLLFLLPASGADNAPSWLHEFASASVPTYDADVPAVVLFRETRLTVDATGRVQRFERRAVKILTRDGRSEALARVRYRTDTGKVERIEAWLIPADGRVRRYAKKDTVDVSLVSGDVYNEARVKAISASSDAQRGDVFGYEAVTEDRSIFTQFEWLFQDELPTLNSIFSLTLPAGWRTETVAFNNPDIEPQVNASTTTWQLRDLPYRERQEAGPSISSLVPRLAVSYFPDQTAGSSVGPAFREWPDVSRWLSGLNETQATPTPALTAKAQELAASGAAEIDKISAIARFVQDVNYVSIQTGVGRGGGYKPHAAGEVFEKSYGDCKDKANLMRTMLKTVGIESYPVAIYSGDRNYVRPGWASPQQFNHAIIAVKVAAGTEVPAAGDYPELGRLLFFDPTDTTTPFGHLPDHEQDSHALLVTPRGGDLIRVPSTEPSENRLHRELKVNLSEAGAIQATLREEAVGQSATDNRRLLKRATQAEYQELIERWVARGAPGSAVTKVDAREDDAGRFELDVEFQAKSYGQAMQDQLIIFKPAVVSRRDALFFTEDTRDQPIILDARAYTESVDVTLPPGFKVDEKPDNVEVDETFGSFSAVWRVDEGHLFFDRSLEIQSAVLAADEYEKVREFFKHVNGAADAPVVLVRN
ncbi:MAG: DUF3857 domain-containing protein [Acidobacteria bacterium]|nr:DUF3857 domain-containing protein [Acidobacteriota bacterium]